jgi:O-antigen/teichoic acid export membrane protein
MMSVSSETAATAAQDETAVLGSFVTGVVLTFGTRLLMLGGVFGSGLIVARWLGPEGFGAYAVLNLTVALALQVGSAGLPSANTYFIARDRSTAGPVWGNAILFGVLVGLLLAVAVVILAWFRPTLFGGISIRLLAIVAVSIPFQLLFLLGLNVLLALDRIRQLNLFDALLPGFVLINAVISLIILHKHLPFLITLNTAAGVGLGLVVAMYVRRAAIEQTPSRTVRSDLKLLKGMLAYGVKFYVSILASAVIFRADLLIVNYFRGAAEAGVYGVAAQFSFLLLMLPGVIATLVFPRVASKPDSSTSFVAEVTRHTTGVMLLTCLMAAVFAFALPLIYGQRFADATIQLWLLLPGIFVMGLESVLVQHFTGTGLPLAIPVFWVFTLVFNVGMNLLIVPQFGARGAAFNSTLSYTLIFFLVTVYFCRRTGRHPGELFVWRASDIRTFWRTATARLWGNASA